MAEPVTITDELLDSIRAGRTVVVPADELAHLRARVAEFNELNEYADRCAADGTALAVDNAKLRARVAELESCEPVAWRYVRIETGDTCEVKVRWPNFHKSIWREEPLFLGPQRMTEREAREAFVEFWTKVNHEALTTADSIWLAALRHVDAIKETP